MPIPLLEECEKELIHTNYGIIQKVIEPADWCLLMVPELKKNGTVCIFVELKKLCESVIHKKHTLPVLDDVLHRLAGSTSFSKSNSSRGFC